MLQILKFIYLTLVKAVIFGATIFAVFYFSFQQYKNWELQKNTMVGPFNDDGICNIAVIPVGGTIGIANTGSYAGDDGLTKSNIAPAGDVDRIISDLEYAKNTPFISGTVLQVDSFGGSLAASEVLFNYLKTYPKPIVSYMRDAGVSGGYLVSLPTQRIFSGRTTQVGSIGVISSVLNQADKNKKDGIKYVEISSGKYKDGLSPDKVLRDDEIQLERDNVKNLAKVFKGWVSEYRKIPLEVVEDLADGRAWSGDEAYKLGLVDEIGDINSVMSYFEKILNMQGSQKAVPCVYNKI